jgi:MerR family redox-sensitive transcriptional activator SoxR
MTISEVAAQTGLQASAIRYYEKAGLLTAPARSGGRRTYQNEILHQLSIICFAKELGFSLDEIRLLLKEFPENAKASPRWNQLAMTKIQEMEDIIHKATAVQQMLKGILRCHCAKLEDCADGLARAGKRSPLQHSFLSKGIARSGSAEHEHDLPEMLESVKLHPAVRKKR